MGIIWFCFAVLFIVSSTPVHAGGYESNNIDTKIQTVISADTYDIIYKDGTTARIHLYGLKTPGPETELGRIAKKHVEGWISTFGSDVSIQISEDNKAKVYINHFYIPDEIMKYCLGTPDSNGDKDDLTRWSFVINKSCIPNKAGLWRENAK